MPRLLTLTAVLVAFAGASMAQQGNPGAHFLEQWDADADGGVTAAEVAAKRSDVFYMFDQDGDGVLSASDWALVEEHMAQELGGGGKGQGQGQGGHGANMAGPGKAVHEAMTPSFNDADGDGSVTVAEFDAASAKLFPLLDQNADGAVTSADFARN